MLSVYGWADNGVEALFESRLAKIKAARKTYLKSVSQLGGHMDTKKSTRPGRRGFIFALTGLISGLLVARPNRIQATKNDIKKFLWNLETDTLERSRPLMHPSITCKLNGDAMSLHRKGETQPTFTVNRVGRTIWEACNGKNTCRDISKQVHDKYLVSSHQAYVDCLAFLSVLKTKGVILL